jgi:lysozyme family protein
MAEFKTAFQKMLIHEGGYVNDPDDQGGETYKGISRTMHKNWSGWGIIDKFKNKFGFPATLDMSAELQNQIELFYRTNFWSPLNADHISNQSIADSIFDFSVNAGVITSVRLAQSIVGVNPTFHAQVQKC